jgi:hypothetical protein
MCGRTRATHSDTGATYLIARRSSRGPARHRSRAESNPGSTSRLHAQFPRRQRIGGLTAHKT